MSLNCRIKVAVVRVVCVSSARANGLTAVCHSNLGNMQNSVLCLASDAQSKSQQGETQFIALQVKQFSLLLHTSLYLG